MAGGAEVKRSIDRMLWYFRVDMFDLPDLAQEPWEEVMLHPVWNQWDNTRAMVRELYQHYQAGNMTPEQRAEFLDLVRLIPSYEPHMRRLRLDPPDIPVDRILAEAGLK